MLRIANPNSALGPSGFVFSRESGVVVQSFDPGHPASREVMDPIPQQHGSEDYSAFLGPRSISIEFRIFPPWSSDPNLTRKGILDDLRGLCNPALRPYLYEGIDGEPERRILLRPDNLSSPYEFPHTNRVQMTFIAPFGIWESGELYFAEVGYGGGGDLNTGRSYDRTFPQSYTSRDPAGAQVLQVGGNIENYPAMICYGPCTSINVANQISGKQLDFPDLVLNSGESIVIDMRRRSITLGGQPNVSKYDKVDWTISDWFTLQPGSNQVSYNGTGGTTGESKMTIAYRENWI